MPETANPKALSRNVYLIRSCRVCDKWQDYVLSSAICLLWKNISQRKRSIDCLMLPSTANMSIDLRNLELQCNLSRGQVMEADVCGHMRRFFALWTLVIKAVPSMEDILSTKEDLKDLL